MALSWKQASLFAAGIAVGAAAALWWVLERQAKPDPAGGPAEAEVVALANALPQPQAVACDGELLVPASGSGDGTGRLAAETEQLGAQAIEDRLRTGKEAAAAGRPRDAELAFLSACRAAERLEDEPLVADTRYQLARHYSYVARTTQDLAETKRKALLQRSEALYGESLRAFRRLHGDDHEMTRFAALGLERVRTALSGGQPVPEESGQAAGAASAGAKTQPAKAEASPKTETPVKAEVPSKAEALPKTKQPTVAPAPAAQPPAQAPSGTAQNGSTRDARQQAQREQQAQEQAAANRQAQETKRQTDQAEARQAAERRAQSQREQEAARQAAAERQPQENRQAQDAREQEAERERAADREAQAGRAAQRREQPEAAPIRQEMAATGAAVSPADQAAVRPSFDCAKARSTPEKLICADPELARQDRELGRLHARAKAAAEDRRAFQRRSDAAWQEREDRCRDAACLHAWFAQRRAQLSAQLGE